MNDIWLVRVFWVNRTDKEDLFCRVYGYYKDAFDQYELFADEKTNAEYGIEKKLTRIKFNTGFLK